MRALASKRRVIALDLPGHGGSSPAAASVSVDGLAASLGEALAVLKIARATIVGFESGAAVAAALARRWSGAQGCIAVDPLPAEDTARAALRDNLVDIAPVWGGGHLLAAWHQLRDAEIWKPWFDRRLALGRALGPDPDVGALDAAITEWMRGGETYMHAARAMLAASPFAALEAARAQIIGFESDPDFAALSVTAGNRFRASSRHPESVARAIIDSSEAA